MFLNLSSQNYKLTSSLFKKCYQRKGEKIGKLKIRLIFIQSTVEEESEDKICFLIFFLLY